MKFEAGSLIWPGGRLDRLNDGPLSFGPDFMRDTYGAKVPDPLVLQVQAYLLRREGQAPVLFDTGSGRFEGDAGGNVARDLARLGVDPAEIGTVALTHLHSDHCGGMETMDFATARIVLTKAEFDHWSGSDHISARLLARYADQVVLCPDGAEIAPGVTLWSLPGHTPGHAGFIIDGQVVVTGDLMHRADLQLPDPRVATQFDVLPDLAKATRFAALERMETMAVAFCGGHLRVPGEEILPEGRPYLRLARDGQGWRGMPA